MYSPHDAATLWQHVAYAEKITVDAWRGLHAADEAMVDALAAHADKVVTKLVRSRGGNITVTVSVEDHRSYCGEAAYFRLKKASNGTYRFLEKLLPEGSE